MRLQIMAMQAAAQTCTAKQSKTKAQALGYALLNRRLSGPTAVLRQKQAHSLLAHLWKPLFSEVAAVIGGPTGRSARLPGQFASSALPSMAEVCS